MPNMLYVFGYKSFFCGLVNNLIKPFYGEEKNTGYSGFL